jgi:hypothetical protein
MQTASDPRGVCPWPVAVIKKDAVPGVYTKPRLMRGMGCLYARTTPGRRDEDVVAPRQRKISRSESVPESEADSVFDDALLLHVCIGYIPCALGWDCSVA